MPPLTHPDEGTVYACPHCDRAKVWKRTRSCFTAEDDDFACHACGDTFDTPIEREKRAPAAAGGGRAKFEGLSWDDLEKASSDDVWREGTEG